MAITQKRAWRAGWICVLVLGTGRTTAAAEYALHGYVREYLSVNLEDKPEPNAHGEAIGGAGQLAMARTVFKLDADAKFDSFYVKAVGRFSRENRTPYLEELEKTAQAGPFPGGSIVKNKYNEDALRELYVGFDLGPSAHVVLGKQQVVWGESDFFRATDVINGYDLRWRAIERENEETRSPLWMANLTLSVPHTEGQLQLIFRPGWDRSRDVVTQRDLFGGRDAGAGYRGVNSLGSAPNNFHNPAGDTDDANYGARWTHSLFDHTLDYSLLYYRGLNREAIVNSSGIEASTISAVNPLGTPVRPVGEMPENGISDIIYPKIDIFGLTFTSDISSQALVLRGEVAYVPNQPYNVGTSFNLALPGIFFGGPPGSAVPLGNVPGLGGIVEKATLRPMLGFDKTIRWTQNVLRTQRPSLWTVEVFDQWILNYDRDDDIVEVFGYGAAAREHQPIFTTTLTLNYDHDHINPSIAMLYDMNFGDAILIPAIDVKFGDHWRFYAEATINLPAHGVKKRQSEVENDTHLLGLGGNNSQLLLRATYQF